MAVILDHSIGKVDGKNWKCSLLHVVVVRCPDPEEEEVKSQISNDPGEETKLGSEESAVYENQRKFYKVPKLSPMHEGWMGSTAVQVTRLIPGGVDIVGLYSSPHRFQS